jgi:hypothetical protein
MEYTDVSGIKFNFHNDRNVQLSTNAIVNSFTANNDSENRGNVEVSFPTLMHLDDLLGPIYTPGQSSKELESDVQTDGFVESGLVEDLENNEEIEDIESSKRTNGTSNLMDYDRQRQYRAFMGKMSLHIN